MEQREDKTFMGEDGFLHCSICFDRVESERCIPGTKTRLPIICSCRKKRLEEEEQRKNAQEKSKRYKEIEDVSLIFGKMKEVLFENCKDVGEEFNKVKSRCIKYCDVFEQVLKDGLGMYLYGSVGTGKSHLCTCMHNELKRKHQQCMYTSFLEISKKIRRLYKENQGDALAIRLLSEIDFLFLDDFGMESYGAENEDSWMQSLIYDVINGRYKNGKPTVFVANRSIEELIKKGLWEKTADRIYEMTSLKISLNGKSLRRNKIKEN